MNSHFTPKIQTVTGLKFYQTYFEYTCCFFFFCYRQGDDGSVGPVDGRMHETISHTCLSSSAEYELALILKELRWITDQVSE